MSGDANDLVVIGGGRAGYVAAIRASQLGLQTAVAEREHLHPTLSEAVKQAALALKGAAAHT